MCIYKIYIQCRIQTCFGIILVVWVPKKMHPKNFSNICFMHILCLKKF